MKTPPSSIFLLAAMIGVIPVVAQESTNLSPATDQVESISTDEETQITGNISDGKPGLPAPKPEPIKFKVQNSLTKPVHVVESPEMEGLPAPQGTIKVTVQMVKDPGLPDPPPPLPATAPEDPAVLARMAEFSKNYRATELVFVSATVYDHSRSLVRCYPNGQIKKEISFWSNLDFNHFSGFATYQVKSDDAEVRQYGLMMGIGNEDTRQRSAWLAKHDRDYQAPEIPKLPDLKTNGPSFVITEGDTDDKEAMALIDGMHNLYRVEGPRMEEAYYARIKAYEERKAFLLANPPVPKNVNVHFWKRNHPLMEADTAQPKLEGTTR